MPMGASWLSDSGGRSWGPGSRESSFQDSLCRDMLEDFLRCHYFVKVMFSCVASSEWSYTSLFQFNGTVPFLMWYTVGNVLSNTTWYWGETCPVLVFNTSSTDPGCNGECPRYTLVFSLDYHLGIPDRSPCSGSSRIKMGQTQVWLSIVKIWNSTPEKLWSGVFPDS